jgi:hypothetical protein
MRPAVARYLRDALSALAPGLFKGFDLNALAG